ncbi:MAG TPA: cation diffusion facilitator family transporter [Candidatus Aminicenantes bacterium]|nr:cation diffusion facilitator family transporter [Candidatus Aminicenantes bacterium]HRY66011.1 cation diffusion facilitator family transporter [Candidatus Aminicenantes bacterium]HRZ72940.1 cation diffusion facilitator family transporter [Candidatus Aminicenantes bacterium]
MSSVESPDKRSLHAVNLALAANTGLAALKTAVGILGHSPALLADGINSTSDVAYNIIIKAFVRLAHKPADADHPYGHRQFESIAALVVGAFVLTTAVAILWDAANEIYDLAVGATAFARASLGAQIVALFTVAVKIWLTRKTRHIARQTGNLAIRALAFDHRNDIFSAAAASIGIFLARSGSPFFDPLAGALVALVIFKTGLGILRESSGDLMDTVPTRELDELVRAAAARIPGVLALEEMQAHRFGPYLVINLTIAVEGGLTVAEGDAIAAHLERDLHRDLDLLRRVHIHYHPLSAANTPPAGS